MSEKDFDLICIGRSCVDLYSGEFGVPLERAMTFTKSVGGSPMNIAIARPGSACGWARSPAWGRKSSMHCP